MECCFSEQRFDTFLTDIINQYFVITHFHIPSGCYKGQETISRLVTYDGIKQRLWGIRLSSFAEEGSAITFDGKKV